jgi:uncharacterized membrane protein YphA (DoxX/SURF4 family)
MPKKRNHLSRVFYHGVRLILGVIFIYASYNKILHPKAFAEVVYNYQILPDGLINVTAIVLPWLEMLMGIFLIMGFWMPGTVIWCNTLLVVYTGALGFNLARGMDINCGCFSTTKGSTIGIGTILWHAAFLTLSIYLFFFVFSQKPVQDQNKLGGGEFF